MLTVKVFRVGDAWRWLVIGADRRPVADGGVDYPSQQAASLAADRMRQLLQPPPAARDAPPRPGDG